MPALDRLPPSVDRRSGRIWMLAVLGTCSAAHVFAFFLDLGRGRGLMDLQPVFTAGVSATLIAAVLLIVLATVPIPRPMRVFDLTLRASLFCSVWISASPIGFVVGDFAVPIVHAPPLGGYELAGMNMLGIIVGPFLSWLALHALSLVRPVNVDRQGPKTLAWQKPARLAPGSALRPARGDAGAEALAANSIGVRNALP